MAKWPRFPVVYEINALVWLEALSVREGHRVTFDTIPQADIKRLFDAHLDAVWLMGAWQRSAQARMIARTDEDLIVAYRTALPDYRDDDIAASPYAVQRYEVDAQLGGNDELAAFRKRLADAGIRILLDFIPNHLAREHHWVQEHPERLVHGNHEMLERFPGAYFRHEADGQTRIFAHGRDPNFPGWRDTVQVDNRRAETRRAMKDILLDIALRCDGVRCDMAMPRSSCA